MKHFFRLNRAKGESHRNVEAASLSIQGQVHVQDEVPNQDTSFELVRRPVYKHQGSSRNRQSIELLHPGIYGAAVFDGHGPKGDTASVLGADRMRNAVHRLLGEDDNTDLEDVVRCAFKEVTEALNTAECGADSGTTASVALMRNNDLVVGHVGDSAVVLVSENSFRICRIKYMTRLHRPSDSREAARVEAAGGIVFQGYVLDEGSKNGLAVSRTLGDRDMQRYGCISEPEIRKFHVEKKDRAVLLASDGFWDHEGIELADVLKTVQKQRNSSAKELCQTLLEQAKCCGAPDDDCTIGCLTFN